MCTVSYLPLPNGGFLLTSSRDETTTRPAAVFPAVKRSGHQPVYFPQDPQSSGTWIAASARRTVCLLNGAFESHTPTPSYRHSRGLVVLSLFADISLCEWAKSYNFDNLEPFTLVIIDSKNYARTGSQQVGKLVEIRWDGSNVYTDYLDPETPRIWSSATLYPQPVRAQRQQWFANWLRKQPTGAFTMESIRAFHKQAGAGDAVNGVLMNRGHGLQTVSLTTVWQHRERTSMYYEDFLTGTLRQQQIASTNEHAFAH